MPDQIDLSKMESVAVMIGGHLRIRRYWKSPTDAFWDDIWKKTSAKNYWRNALAGSLPAELSYMIGRHAFPGARILEAGCGMGQVALALKKKGYASYGLDFAQGTIEMLREKFPCVPFIQGDIHSLPFPDAFFDLYISLGVIEHFIEGQNVILTEAARVVKPRGKIILSVPAVNSYRRFRYRLGRYKKSSSMPFFEDCYSLQELRKLFNDTGFSLLEFRYQNTVMTFVQESLLRGLYLTIEDVRYVRGIIDRILNFMLPRTWFGHTLMVVGEKV
jgi:ubiquinone/menaquinone biosynthesis C-methylase UbiE